MENKKVWFITGASKGLGLALVKQLLAQGYRVAATSRNEDELNRAVGANGKENFLPLVVNLKSEQSIAEAIEKTISRFEKIDVVVNNAGYGLTGSLEELTDEEARENFEINVFASLSVIRQAMPHLRTQQSGRIFNISSIAGFTGSFLGFSIYCATKFAVQGFTESLAAEVKPFNVYATVVYPGYFRTSFLTSDSLNIPKKPIQEYQLVRNLLDVHQQQINGNQPGDPEKAAAVLIKTAMTDNPPLHLFLGQDAYDMAQQKIAAVEEALETWKAETISTGF